MKLFYLVGLLLLGVMWCQASSESESNELQDITKKVDDDDDDFYNIVKGLFEKKCQKVGGDDAVKKLTTAIDGIKVCVGSHLPKNKDELKDLKDSGSSEELCSDKRGKVFSCFDELVHVWEDCSEPEEKYMPKFVVDAVDAVFDYVCADDGAVILKIFDADTLECIMSIAEKENINDVCTDKFKFLKDDTPEEIVISKAELCEDLATAKSCYGDFIKEQCPGDSNFRDLVIGFYAAISSPCHADPKNPLKLNLPS